MISKDFENSDEILVHFPNLFVSFLAETPVLNRHYEKVRPRSEERVCRECGLKGRVATGVRKCNFSYFAAVMASEANEADFATICDWGNWIFPFDDLFDDGEFRANYEGAKVVINQLLLPLMDETGEGSAPAIVKFHDGIWERIKAGASLGVQRRYARAMSDYCSGALDQVFKVDQKHFTTPDEMLAMRRRSVCVASLFALVEFGHRWDISEDAIEHPAVKEIEAIGIDLTFMHNDLLSYPKEESEGVSHNLVAMYRASGMTAQDAINHIGQLIEARHRQMDFMVSQLPSWTPLIDKEIRKYVQGIKNVVKANLYWSFESGRFLTEAQKEEVRNNGKIAVLKQPIFLNKSNIIPAF